MLRVCVTVAGEAAQVEVAESSGNALLDRAAVDAVRRWRFVPARRGTEVIAGVVRVPIAFRLRGET